MARTQAAPSKKSTGSPNSSSSSRTLLLIVGFVVVAALIIAVVLSGTGETSSAAELDATVTVTGGPLPPAGGPGSPDPAAGLAAPEVSGADFAGNPVSISNDGKPKIVILIAHWCPHCQVEVPEVQKWVDANGLPTDVELISVATSINRLRDNFPAQKWLEREGWTVPVIVDDQASSVWQAYGQLGFPAFVIIDRNGNVVARPTGEGQAAFFDDYLSLLRAS